MRVAWLQKQHNRDDKEVVNVIALVVRTWRAKVRRKAKQRVRRFRRRCGKHAKATENFHVMAFSSKVRNGQLNIGPFSRYTTVASGCLFEDHGMSLRTGRRRR